MRKEDQENLLTATGEYIRSQTEPLKKRIEALEAQIAEMQSYGIRYCGVYQRAQHYKRGDTVTHDGSMHTAIADVQPGQAPIQSDKWQLSVKRGRDGKYAA